MKYIIIILLFASCNATKQAAKDEKKTVKFINRAIKISRVTAAKVTRDSFPCTDLFRTDTTLIVLDSTVYVDCPDYHIADSGKMVHDTTTVNNKATVKYIKVPVHIPVRTQIITKYFEDSAKVLIAQKEVATVNQELLKYKGKAERRGKLNLYLIIALLLSALLNFIQFKRK